MNSNFTSGLLHEITAIENIFFQFYKKKFHLKIEESEKFRSFYLAALKG